MPVKVRCPGCKKVLTAPDRARGKALRCPNCETRVRVPAGRTVPKSRPAKAAKVSSRQPSVSDDDFLAGLDVRRLESQATPVCPKCGAEVFEDDDYCPECGVHLLTGKMPEKRKGPDPARFYRDAWADSWTFLRTNVNLAVKTGFIVSLFNVLAIASGVMVSWVETGPPKTFWGFLLFLFVVGMYGWLWYLTLEVIKTTLDKKSGKVKRARFDFFLAIALGVKAVVWPVVLMLPVIPFALLIAIPMGVVTAAGLGTAGVGLMVIGYLALWAFPLLVYPIAMVHMTVPYTYKAWLPWEMIRLFFKNIGPSLYWVMVAVAVQLPLVLPLLVVGLLFGADIGKLLTDGVHAASDFMLGLHGVRRSESDPSFWQSFYDGTVGLLVLYLCLAPLWFLEAFPAVFTMRAIGLLGYYNRRRLDLVYEQPANIPCGFGPRYLAYLVDYLIIGLMTGFVSIVLYGLGLMFLSFGVTWTALLLFWAAPIVSLAITILYYVKWEAGIAQGTLGKRALGIIVTDMTGNQISKGTALARFFGRIVSGAPMGIGFLLCAFTEKKQTLHDMMSKTLVVWRGDDETTE